MIPSLYECLEHRHAYVRKNAIFAFYSIANDPSRSYHIPDAATIVEKFIEQETDVTCICNAFIAISNLDREKAISFIIERASKLQEAGDLLQLAVVGFISRDAPHHPENKALYFEIAFKILDSSTNTSIYEAAIALTKLSSDPTVIKGAVSKLVELAIKEPDNNVKLIVFDQVEKLHKSSPGVLNDLNMEILVALNTANLDVCKKALDISLSMVTNRTVDYVIKLLKKELNKTLNHDYEKNLEYRKLLIKSIHTCAVKFVLVARSVVETLLNIIGKEGTSTSALSTASSVDVISFVKLLRYSQICFLNLFLNLSVPFKTFVPGLLIVALFGSLASALLAKLKSRLHGRLFVQVSARSLFFHLNNLF